MKPHLQAIVDRLLAGTKGGDAIELDAVGEAIGDSAVSQDEIDLVIRTIEARGRKVSSPSGGTGEARLKTVLAAARELRTELGRAPRVAEIAARAGIDAAEVEHALALAKIIQR